LPEELGEKFNPFEDEHEERFKSVARKVEDKFKPAVHVHEESS
jgi:hypothetical protein